MTLSIYDVIKVIEKEAQEHRDTITIWMSPFLTILPLRQIFICFLYCIPIHLS